MVHKNKLLQQRRARSHADAVLNVPPCIWIAALDDADEHSHLRLALLR
jgi:hypothetical protein